MVSGLYNLRGVESGTDDIANKHVFGARCGLALTRVLQEASTTKQDMDAVITYEECEIII